MASIARSLRPVASRLAMTARVSGRAASWQASSLGLRSFSASKTVQVKKYTKDHEWIDLSEDGKTGVIGISDYAAHALGDVVYVELPTVPMEVAAGDSIGAVESVKSASDINSPISGTITAVNSLLEEKPGTINKGPEDESSAGGWMAKIEVGDAGIKDMDGLMDAKQYKEFTEE
ncbi:Glycine cleavage H-protein [Venustampulla echinocandica]|uniref:Glycine cleavage system H protein n=1 Tax=Venustampulla echinocandica TaxID=2656787 RepID=A0A370TVR0_9HELO|nr:Glycine cleavage H-protein [Venustampulla echinocandica]RDL39616.1 Glycine cleavage H-protein [Venustampulla echinocandica]